MELHGPLQITKCESFKCANKNRNPMYQTMPGCPGMMKDAKMMKSKLMMMKVPKGSHRMPDGSIMKDSAMAGLAKKRMMDTGKGRK